MSLTIKRLLVTMVGTAVVTVLAMQPVVTGQTQTPAFVARAQEGPGDIDQGPEGPGDIDQPPRDDHDVPRPEPEFGAIKVIKFKDVDGDGVEDPGEPRMSGVLFHLDRHTIGSRQGVTNAQGEILWFNVSVGAHTVLEVVPTGFAVTTGNPRTVTVVANQTAVVKFGNHPIVVPQKARLEVIKIKDENGNGACEKGEPGLPGVRFTVLKGGQVVAEGTTNVAGLVEFDLDPGTYVVLEEVPAGFEVVGPNPQTVTLAGGDDKALAFCNKPKEKPKKASIKVIKFKDVDGDGLEDPGEPRLSGVVFTVDGGMTKTTDANGEAIWADLSLGTYKVVEKVPTGFKPTTPTEQTATLTQDGQTVTLIFGNQPIPQLPPTGAFNVLLPSTAGVLTTLYTMVRRQRRHMIDLLRNV